MRKDKEGEEGEVGSLADPISQSLDSRVAVTSDNPRVSTSMRQLAMKLNKTEYPLASEDEAELQRRRMGKRFRLRFGYGCVTYTHLDRLEYLPPSTTA